MFTDLLRHKVVMPTWFDRFSSTLRCHPSMGCGRGAHRNLEHFNYPFTIFLLSSSTTFEKMRSLCLFDLPFLCFTISMIIRFPFRIRSLFCRALRKKFLWGQQKILNSEFPILFPDVSFCTYLLVMLRTPKCSQRQDKQTKIRSKRWAKTSRNRLIKQLI